MRVVSLQGQIFDLDQIASTRLGPTSVLITFKNGDQFNLSWRDNSERLAVLNALELNDAATAQSLP